MSEFNVNANLQTNYEEYYGDGASEWRWLGALDKAHNIESLCETFPIHSVLDIGAGEGSVLKRLSDIGFAQELYPDFPDEHYNSCIMRHRLTA
jgi:hypothetical protein